MTVIAWIPDQKAASTLGLIIALKALGRRFEPYRTDWDLSD